MTNIKKVLIGYQGIRGCYSHQAAEQFLTKFSPSALSSEDVSSSESVAFDAAAVALEAGGDSEGVEVDCVGFESSDLTFAALRRRTVDFIIVGKSK